MKDGAPPGAALLPVEPARPYPVDTLEDAVARRAGNLNPYQIASADFDISFLTPVLSYAAQQRSKQWSQPSAGERRARGGAQMTVGRPPMDFANWSEYVETVPPVLLVRVTPKLVEGFWVKVARGAASDTGRLASRRSSASDRASRRCARSAATPRSRPSTRSSSNTASRTAKSIYEGLYVFDPGAFTPECASVKLMLYSEKEPDKAITQLVDAKVIQQIWQDFAAYRAVK